MTVTSMEDLKTNMCRWPHGDPRHKEKFHFCGAQRSGSSSYCCKHEALARRSSETQAKTTQKAA